MFATRKLFRLALASLLLCAGAALAHPVYTVTALPVGTYAYAINNSGQVVGDYPAGAEGQAFFWSAGVLAPLGTLGGTYSSGRGIGSNGWVAGFSTLEGGVMRAFVHDGARMRDLGTLGGVRSSAHGVNGSGVVVGQSENAMGQYRAFAYSGGRMVDLGTLGGDFGYAAAVNDAGQVVGEASLDNDFPVPETHAFLYDGGTMRDLGTLGGRMSSAAALNESGQVAGYAYTAQSVEHAFLYTDGAMLDLGTLGGRRSFAYGINSMGQVVGQADLAGDLESHAFIYSNGVLTDLNTLIDPALGWVLREARGINDLGQVAAYGCMGETCQAVLLNLVPSVPEPRTYMLALAGLAMLGWSRVVGRRRA